MREKIKKFPIGGTHLPEEKHLTSDTSIAEMNAPDEVTVALKQHIGFELRPAVSVGQRVRRGELVGRPEEDHLYALIHAGVTGEVISLDNVPMIDGTSVQTVRIRTDRDASSEEFLLEPLDTESMSPDDLRREVISRVEAAGIVGLGGAGFPTHIKLASKNPIDTVIVNGAECEPYITVDDRLMQEQPELLLRGVDLIRRVLGAKQGIIACEVNKPKALEQLKKTACRYPAVSVQPLGTRYPHGAEKHLIKAVLRREVPLRSLPTSVGVVVNNVQTACAVAEAVDAGRTLHRRVITVSGYGAATPGNLLVPLGSSVGDVIAACGGTTGDDIRVIMGGPMTGTEVTDFSVPVIKSTSGIVLLTREEYAEYVPAACIRCGKCLEVCPMYLPPNRMTAYLNSGMMDEAVEAGLEVCILCGACQYVCPSKRPLVAWIKSGKAQLSAWKQKHK